jgi:hypothetical protein
VAAHPLPAEVRAARSFLRQRGIRTEDLSPRTFASAAKESGAGFKNTLRTIGHMMMGGQNSAADLHARIQKEAGNEGYDTDDGGAGGA